MFRSAGDLGFVLAPVALGALADCSSVELALQVRLLVCLRPANELTLVLTEVLFTFSFSSLAGACRNECWQCHHVDGM